MSNHYDEHPVEDFLKPKIASLINEARAAGYPQDVIVAVLIDLLDNDTCEGGPAL
ncbi:hypothetical protein [Neokomagataea thailandica]|uniref:Uncharacterized protein n=1 Tax=Neokomagataea tanensis NBRC 106556 TaxID=1223519 RepID=A0ABQ0QHY0_9PROT|nr:MULTISPECIES: hypothetical protein [Neokomagataea]GBR45475.1 hypothetical protein AA106556_0780 [Neokomagataea tanensis NBRC 106556]